MWGVSSVHELREESRVFTDLGFVQETRPRIGVQYVEVTPWNSSCDHPSFHLSVDGDEAKDVKDDPEYSFPPAPAILWAVVMDVLQHIDKFGMLDFFKWLVTGNEPLNQDVLEFILAKCLLEYIVEEMTFSEASCLANDSLIPDALATASNGVSCITIFEDQVELVKRFKMCTQMTDKTYGSS
ncbi:hypothetical protein C8J56DRAFT_886474 [Mycena floridula]|nr:hypothetical protein C8J56DRAFT_886474 [Mycena floridula]